MDAPPRSVSVAADVVRCVTYDRISDDHAGDEHGVLNQRGDLRRRAEARGWTITRELSDNDIGVTRSIANALKEGKYRAGWDEVIRLVEAHAVDVVFVWRLDRALREPIDLEYLIPVFDAAGVRLAEAEGMIDLGTESGRLAARIFIAFAKAEQERKSARQKLANRGAAERGERKRGGTRPFGWTADRKQHEPDEAEAIREACRMILGGATLSAVVKDWTAKGLRPPQAPFGPLPRKPWKFGSVRGILLSPANAGLSAYCGEIVGKGQWEPIISEETQKAVAAKLADGPRAAPEGAKPRRAGRSLLGSLALCPCGSIVYAGKSSRGVPNYRCAAALNGNAGSGPHVTRYAAAVDSYIGEVVIKRLSRDDASDLLIRPANGPDVPALREEAAAIRVNLNEMASDRALGLIDREQMIKATARANERLAEIDADIKAASREDVLAPLVAAENAAAVWETLDLSRKRAVINALMTITLKPVVSRGKAHQFDPASVAIDWKRG